MIDPLLGAPRVILGQCSTSTLYNGPHSCRGISITPTALVYGPTYNWPGYQQLAQIVPKRYSHISSNYLLLAQKIR